MDDPNQSTSSSLQSHVLTRPSEEGTEQSLTNNAQQHSSQLILGPPVVQPIQPPNNHVVGSSNVVGGTSGLVVGGWHEGASQPIILQIPTGLDIIQTVKDYAQDNQATVFVFAGYGVESELDVCFPDTQPLFQKIVGNFELLSFTGSCAGSDSSTSSSTPSVSSFMVSVVGAKGDVLDGLFFNSLIVASPVQIFSLKYI